MGRRKRREEKDRQSRGKDRDKGIVIKLSGEKGEKRMTDRTERKTNRDKGRVIKLGEKRREKRKKDRSDTKTNKRQKESYQALQSFRQTVLCRDSRLVQHVGLHHPLFNVDAD